VRYLQKNNIVNNNIRPVSSKPDNQKIIPSNNPIQISRDVVNSIKKPVVPEKKIGNQIKIAENLIKNNNYNYNYNNVKGNNNPQPNNFLRANQNNKVEPVKVANAGGNRGYIKK